jgi:hypothetical protein
LEKITETNEQNHAILPKEFETFETETITSSNFTEGTRLFWLKSVIVE